MLIVRNRGEYILRKFPNINFISRQSIIRLIMRIIYAISLFVFSSFVFLNAADEHISYMFDKSNPPEHIVDIIHIEAHIEFEPFKHQVIGHTIFETVSKRNSGDSVIFFAPDFQFSSVKIKVHPVKVGSMLFPSAKKRLFKIGKKKINTNIAIIIENPQLNILFIIFFLFLINCP